MVVNPQYELIEGEGAAPVKAWIRGVSLEDQAREQITRIARMPFVFRWVAVMPDVHWGIGATVGSVIPTRGAVIPAAVGVDIGCGMMAIRTTLRASDLPDDLHAMRTNIEKAVPHGRTDRGGRGDRGSWHDVPGPTAAAWAELEPAFRRILDRHRKLAGTRTVHHLGTLGTGNHFIEVCLDEEDRVWFLLHSGSRGIGNRIGTYFIELAKKDMGVHLANLPDEDLAYLREGTRHFDEYCEAVEWAQRFAMRNRELMMGAVVRAVASTPGVPPFTADEMAVNCHHNYVNRETHYGESVLVTRKGAVRAGAGDLGIIPGSMGARSYIVRGRGNPESFSSCSHGAGRAMSRAEAKRRFTLADHAEATKAVECRKDADVIDETPGAYKPIDAVMEAQKDLVEIAHELRQVVCVKG
ncbi:MAG: RtcB family protein [Gemmatimonadaceae bacterium]|nr:RtcB family protein [Planctomycetota bacterium]NUQ10894.1 RtcB family protein [Gemmatimonadaceae bacterium]